MASDHLVYSRSVFTTYKRFVRPQKLKCVNSDQKSDLNIHGKGDIWLSGLQGEQCVQLSNVLHVPQASLNLLSVSKIARRGYDILFNDECATIIDRKSGKILSRAPLVGDFYRLEFQPEKLCAFVEDDDVRPSTSQTGLVRESGQETLTADSPQERKRKSDSEVERSIRSECKKSKSVDMCWLWHQRFGHISAPYLRRAINNTTGLENLKFSLDFKECETCAQASLKKKLFKKIRERAVRPLEIIHSDLMCVSKPTKKYICTFIDDFSRFAVSYVISHKNDVFKQFVAYKAWATAQFNGEHHIRKFRCDNGTEYDNAQMESFLCDLGILANHTRLSIMALVNGSI